MANDTLRPNYYATVAEYTPSGKTLAFYARVKMMPVFINEYSHGHGGFMLSARIVFEDGTGTELGTDENWLVRVNGAYVCPGYYDNGVEPTSYTFAAVTLDIWHPTDAPIPPREEWIAETVSVTLAPGETVERAFSFDTVYAGYLDLSVRTAGELTGQVYCV